jgi:plastocyanin
MINLRLSLAPVVVMGAILTGCGTAAESEAAASQAHESHAAQPSATAAAAPSEEAVDEEPPADATVMEDGAVIVMSQIEFSETAVIVPVGATLTFTNEDNVGHTVTHGVQGFRVDDPAFNKPVQAGDSTDVIFTEPGRYDITCEPHPIMQMTVFVEG